MAVAFFVFASFFNIYPTSTVNGLVTGKNDFLIQPADADQKNGSRLDIAIDQLNHCYNDTDCDNKTDTDIQVDLLKEQGVKEE